MMISNNPFPFHSIMPLILSGGFRFDLRRFATFRSKQPVIILKTANFCNRFFTELVLIQSHFFISVLYYN